MTVFEEAQKLLDYVVQAAFDVSLDLPSKQYITAGEAVHDCEQVVVTIAAVNTGLPASTTPAGSIGACPLPWSAVIDIAIVRCCPVPTGNKGTPPAPELLQAHALIQSRDTEVLIAVANSRANERFGNVIANITFPPPQGGIAPTVCRYQVAIVG